MWLSHLAVCIFGFQGPKLTKLKTGPIIGSPGIKRSNIVHTLLSMFAVNYTSRKLLSRCHSTEELPHQSRTPESPTPTCRWPLFQWWECTRTVQGGTLVLSEESRRLFMWNGNDHHWPTLCEWYSSLLSYSHYNLHIKNHKTELMVHR